MDPRLAPLAHTLHLNTRLLENCLAGVDDAQALRRVTPETNSMAFLVAHLADARHFLAGVLGTPLENPLAEILEYGKSQDEIGELPPLGELLAIWRRIGAHLDDTLPSIGAGRLDAESGLRFPIGDRTTLGSVAFLVQHDSYHLGQVSLLRRAFGLPAMSYR
ncbi:MAG: hypothetical protein H6R40_1059 [Gemmatimonadetes bacterium]|nr:hypothetical protein [Gemmatimonadota bacterium]